MNESAGPRIFYQMSLSPRKKGIYVMELLTEGYVKIVGGKYIPFFWGGGWLSVKSFCTFRKATYAWTLLNLHNWEWCRPRQICTRV